jgi:pre-mRNA-splicing factor ATP-dependent RNA helicase DHX16
VLLAVYQAWQESGYSTVWCGENFVQAKSMKRARDVREQLVALCERVEVPLESAPGDSDALGQAIASGFFYNTAKMDRTGTYRTVKRSACVHIHPSSCLAKAELPPLWVVFHELVDTGKEYMRQVFTIKKEWLGAIAPHYFSKKDLVDEGRRKRGGAGEAADIADGQDAE